MYKQTPGSRGGCLSFNKTMNNKKSMRHYECALFSLCPRNKLQSIVYLPILKGETLPSPESKWSNSSHVDLSWLTPSAWQVECLMGRL